MVRQRVATCSLTAISVPAFLVAWAVLAARLESPYLPPLGDVWEAFQRNWLFERLPTDVLPSLERLTVGYAIGVIAGIVLGAALGSSTVLRMTLMPTVEFLRAIPPIVIIPAVVIVLGATDVSKILVIAIGAAMPVLINAVDGVRSLDATLQDYVQVYRVGRQDRWLVRLRWASPQIVAGARTALAIAFILMVTSEMMAASNGIGYFVLISQRTFAIADMWSGILLLGALGAAFNLVFLIVERVTLGWYRGLKAPTRAGT